MEILSVLLTTVQSKGGTIKCLCPSPSLLNHFVCGIDTARTNPETLTVIEGILVVIHSNQQEYNSLLEIPNTLK